MNKSNIVLYLFCVVLAYCNCFNAIGQNQNQREYYIDLKTFDEKIKEELDGEVKGYAYSIRDKDFLSFSNSYGIAKTEKDGGPNTFKVNSQMDLASVSKMIAWVVMLHMLENNTVTGAQNIITKLDLFLKDFIPPRWTNLIDGDEDKITLRHLFMHTSGFPHKSPGNVWKNLKKEPATTSLPGEVMEYENVNPRTAMTMVAYMVYPNEMLTIESQNLDDEEYAAAVENLAQDLFLEYAQSKLIQPMGLNFLCQSQYEDPEEQEVYAYKDIDDEEGRNTGNGNNCVTSGWIVSAPELVEFMHKATNLGLESYCLSPLSVKMLNNFAGAPFSLGWASTRTPWFTGTLLGHTGDYSIGGNHFKAALLLGYDNNTYISLIINSKPNKSQVDIAADAYSAAHCADDILLASTVSTAKFYSAGNTITAQNNVQVPNGKTVVYKATNKIVLKPGFSAHSGSQFRAVLANCTTPPSFDSLVTTNQDEVPDDIKLEPKKLQLNVYPNPFNGKTNISINVPELSKTTVQIFGLDGRVVATLMNNEMKSPGNYRLNFDGSNLPAGVYFVHFQNGYSKTTKKLMLMK